MQKLIEIATTVKEEIGRDVGVDSSAHVPGITVRKCGLNLYAQNKCQVYLCLKNVKQQWHNMAQRRCKILKSAANKDAKLMPSCLKHTALP